MFLSNCSTKIEKSIKNHCLIHLSSVYLGSGIYLSHKSVRATARVARINAARGKTMNKGIVRYATKARMH